MQRLKSHSPERPTNRPNIVLVVDDEIGPRESLRMTLSSSYQVLTAHSGLAALEILRSRPVDLVTVDLNMPGIKGDQLVAMIRDEFPEIEIIIITGFATIEAAVAGIRRGVCDFLTKPFDVVQVNTAVSSALHRQRGRRRLFRFLEGMGDAVGRDRTADEILRELETNQQLQNRLQALLEEPLVSSPATADAALSSRTIEFLELLANTLESRDPEMRGHARRVSFYSGLIADHMKLESEQRDHVRIAAFLHDLGKIGLTPDAAPIGEKVGPQQRSALEEHSSIGEKLLLSLGIPNEIVSAVRHHHERWDGRGYPDGLRAHETPLLARIIAVADAFDAMVCNQAHAPSVGREAALCELRAEAGAQFDAQVVGVLCEIAQLRNTGENPSETSSAATRCGTAIEGTAGELAR